MICKTIYLVRHAQGEPSAGLARQWPLSEVGREQAIRLTAALATLGIEVIHSSPSRRCLETMVGLAAAGAVPLHIENQLRERRIAPAMVEDLDDAMARSWADFARAQPGLESSSSVQRRVVGAVRSIARHTAFATIAICSHAEPLALLLNALDPSHGLEQAVTMRTPEVFRLTWDDPDLRLDPGFQLDALDEFASRSTTSRFSLGEERWPVAGLRLRVR